MTYTFEEIIERLKLLDTIDLIEMLDISSEVLVDRFADLVERDPERFIGELEQWFGEDDDVLRETS